MSKHTEGPWFFELHDIPLKDGKQLISIQSREKFNPDDEDDDPTIAGIWSLDPVDFSNAALMAQSPDLLKALEWALPLAKLAMEAHRMDRLKCGHNDIVGKYKSGQTWAGIYQSEIDEIEFADLVIAKAKGLAK